jgi:hypothetical protein
MSGSLKRDVTIVPAIRSVMMSHKNCKRRVDYYSQWEARGMSCFIFRAFFALAGKRKKLVFNYNYEKTSPEERNRGKTKERRVLVVHNQSLVAQPPPSGPARIRSYPCGKPYSRHSPMPFVPFGDIGRAPGVAIAACQILECLIGCVFREGGTWRVSLWLAS